MFDLEVVVVAGDDARRAAKTARKRKVGGRGAPGRPKSAAHRKAIGAGLRRYWGSKRAAHRRRRGGKAARSNSTRARTKRTKRTKSTTTRSGKTKPTPAHAKGAQIAMSAAKPRRASLIKARRRSDTARYM